MGEAKRKKKLALNPLYHAVAEATSWVETPGGKLQVHWNDGASVTPFAQMAFFIKFLNLTGVLESWIGDCPLTYLSPNAPTKWDLLGTWLLSILSGHRRYAHVTSIRGDGVNPGLLGMSKVVSEDALRRGLAKIGEESGVAWLREHLERSVLPLLKAPWILDVDTSTWPRASGRPGLRPAVSRGICARAEPWFRAGLLCRRRGDGLPPCRHRHWRRPAKRHPGRVRLGQHHAQEREEGHQWRLPCHRT